VIAAGLALLGSTGCAEGRSYAVRVGDETVPLSDFEDELDAAVELPGLDVPGGLSGAAPGSYSQAYVGQYLQLRIVLEVVRQEVEDRGIEVTDDHRQQGIDQLLGGEELDGIDASLRDLIVESYAQVVALGEDLGGLEQVDSFLDTALAEADISVNTRFGRWDPTTVQVIPPEGPREPSTAGTG
jgi:hypothetical protein